MTKRKVIDDLLGRGTKDYVAEYNDYNIFLNGHFMICDRENIPVPEEYDLNKFDNVENMYNNVFPYDLAYELSEAIEVNYEALKKFIKGKRRNDYDKKPFVIDLGNNRYICVDAWYLRDAIEYLSDRYNKNYNIYIKNDFFNRGEYAIYKSPIYMFGGNQLNQQKLIFLPVNYISDRIEASMKWEVKWN